MATYDHKQVFSDYANGKITPEMAVGHSLQHIDKLYEAQTWRPVNGHQNRRPQKARQSQQAVLDRLTAFMEKLLRKPKKPNSPTPPKPDQP